MIKIKFRKNLLYLLVYYISSFIDYNVIATIIFSKFNFNPTYACVLLFPVENIIGGLVVFLYQKHSIKSQEKMKYFGMELLDNQKKVINDAIWKKILLILFASYFSYFNTIVGAFYIMGYIPWSMDLRLSSIQIISSTLICMYVFEFKLKKHHKVSLIIIGIFLFISMCIDSSLIIYYKYKNIAVPMFQYFLTLYYYIGFSLNNCIEKYLVDINYMNPFIILLIEGVFQLAMAGIISIWTPPFEEFKSKEIQANQVLFICLYVLFFILQIVVNVYRIYCNVIYSPMARSLIDYLLNPFVNIYFYFAEKDFFDNLAYFIATEIICLIMSFFGCVFNEYIILYVYGLELETQDEIVYRAVFSKTMSETELDIISKKEKEKKEGEDEEDEEDDDDEDDDYYKKKNEKNKINKIQFTHTIVNIDGYSVDLNP